MSTFRRFTIAALVIGGLAAGGTALAKGGGSMHHGVMKAMQALDLSDEQKSLAQDLHDELKGDREGMKDEKDAVADQVIAELGKESPDAEALHALIDERMAIAQERMHDRTDAFLELHATFDEAQRATLVTQLEEMKERGGEHHGKRGRGGPTGAEGGR